MQTIKTTKNFSLNIEQAPVKNCHLLFQKLLKKRLFRQYL